MYLDDEIARSLREQMQERLLEVKAITPAEQLALAKFFERAGDTETAKEMLFKAWRIRQLTPYPTSDDNYTGLAKRLRIEETEMKSLPPPTAELCEEYGFILLKPENCPKEVEIEWNTEARFAAIASDGQLSLFQFNVRSDYGTFHTDSYQTTFGEHGFSQGRTQSSGSHIPLYLPVGDQEGAFNFSLVSEPPPGSEGPIRVRIEFRRKTI